MPKRGKQVFRQLYMNVYNTLLNNQEVELTLMSIPNEWINKMWYTFTQWNIIWP